MGYVFIPDVWGPDRTRLMNQYIIAIVELLTRFEGPDELGLTQMMDELNADQEMFQAVWAHLYTWQRNLLLDIREKHDRRRQTRERIEIPRHDGRPMRLIEGRDAENRAKGKGDQGGDVPGGGGDSGGS